MKPVLRLFHFFLLALVAAAPAARATHFYGADFFYTHLSGNTYRISLVVYGDCAGQSFPFLTGATPEVQIYKNGTQLQSTITLSQFGAPVEVTPVCPSQVNNTKCANVNNPVPGVTRFTYTANYTLNGTSSNWRFVTTGSMGANSLAGRSNAISNISAAGGGSIMILEATLNNTVSANSSPTYTTIPTPFFCINKPAQYNPGAVDPDGDVLGFDLVPGLQVLSGSTTVTNVTYISPYSGASPLATAAGTFLFSATTGQLGFTPNLVQQSLVVSRVTEFRNGVQVGTSMREMTFVVLATCNNNPPLGTISNPSGGTATGATSIQVCQSQGTFSFAINPTDSDGDPINVVAAGVPAGATFNIFGNNTTAPTTTLFWNVSNVAPGAYTFFITYTDEGCPLSSRQTLAYTINVLPRPALNVVVTHLPTCTRRAAFTATASGTNQLPSFTFTASQGGTPVLTLNSGTSFSVSDSLTPGTYTIRVANGQTCFKDTTITIAPPAPAALTATATPPTCNGGANGTITATAASGLAPYQFALGAGAFGGNSTFSGLAAGTYTVRIKDANDCEATQQVVVPVTPTISATVSLAEPPCNAFQSGSITVAGINGAAPYQYALGLAGTFSSTATFTGLGSGLYIIRVRDANLCTRDTLVLLPDSVQIHAPATLTPIVCNGATSGAIVLSAFGTAAPYTYALGSGAGSAVNTFPNLAAGSYTFHVSDLTGCYLDTTIVLTQPAAIVPTATALDVTCPGGADGSISISAAGGTPGYTYALGSGAFGSVTSFTNLAAGTYVVQVQDAAACVRADTVEVVTPPPFAVAATATSPTCYGASIGSLSMTLTGGTPPYFYALNTGVFGSANTFPNLPAGTYTLHGKDGNGCTRDTTIILTQPPAIVPSVVVENSDCAPLHNGSIVVSATGGTPGTGPAAPYTFALGAGTYGASGSFSPLPATTYTVHVKDGAGCIKDTVVAVLDSLNVIAAVTITPALCFDSLSGTITAVGSGGATPYQYSLGTGAFSPSALFPNLHAGTYVLHVKDTLGCTLDTTLALMQPTRVQPLATLTQPLCHGGSNGSIQMTPTGGTPAYTYAMGSGPFGAASLFGGLSTGAYTIRTRDANGCTIDTTLNLGEPTPIVVTSLTGTAVLCHGGSTGTITVGAAGGVPAYTYAADAGTFASSSTLTGLAAGVHTVRIRDANNCTKDTTFFIAEPAPLRFAAMSILNPTCEGFTDGRITVSGGGGVPPYQYARNGGTYASATSFNNLGPGTHTLSVRDANGCTKDTAIILTGYPYIVVEDAAITPVRCWGEANGDITLATAGGLAYLTYQIIRPNPPKPVTSIPSWDSLEAGSYTIRIRDSGGCYKDTTLVVTQPDVLAVTGTATQNDCIGYNDGGTARVKVTGGTEPYTYAWREFPRTNDPQIIGLPNGSFFVTVTDTNKCTDTLTLRVAYDNCCLPFIPTAFSPNSDGLNDRFSIRYKGDMKLQNLSVYNRYGQRVFYTTSMADSWDGRFNGDLQDMGVYFYYAKIICGNAGTNVVEYKGDVTLVR